MNIVIVYSLAGAGHRRSAEALYKYFKENCQSVEVKIIDVLEKAHPLFQKIHSYGYAFLVNHLVWIWRFGFWLTSLKGLRGINNAIKFVIDRLSTKKFAEFLTEKNPDCVISTHFLPSEVSAYLKRKGRINSKLVTVITDFSVHPYWICAATDIYVVASTFAKEQLISEGIKENNIREFGIPIDAKFLIKHEKVILSKKFGIAENKFTALIVTGSFGLGPIEEIADLLYKDIQVLVICANNKKLYAKLKNKNYPGVKVFGFVDNIEELMATSDIIIMKPGGVSISEILAMELIPIFISPIPGQETANMQLLKKYGVGHRRIERIYDIKNIILDYKEHPDKLKSMKEKMAAIKKPFAAREICNVIC